MVVGKGMSRRGFLGGAVLAGAVSAGMLAGCSPSASGKGSSAEESGKVDADVLVVGSGLAGMCAALKLRELGVSTMIVEKGDSLNSSSNSAISSGMFCFPSDETQESKDALYQVFANKSKGEGDEAITHLIVDTIRGGMDWLKSYGCEFTDEVDASSNDHKTCFAAPGASQGMGPLLQKITEAYHGLDGSEEVGAKVIDFIMNDAGGIGGVKVRGKEGIKTIACKAVIVAAGGYVANRQLMEMFVGPESDEMMMRGNKSITGDVILAGERAGAMLYQMGGMQSIHVGAVAPDAPAAGNPYLAIPYTIAVNSDGVRYTDESLGYVNNGKALMEQANPVCALIFDETIKAVGSVTTDYEKFAKMGTSLVEADSLSELAEKINVPASALEQTVAEFNAATDGEKTMGLAVEKSRLAMKVEGPKYYAFYPLRPGSIMAFGGFHVDEDCQVLEADETPIAGMYAAGECIGGVFKYDYPAGASVARCITTGIAAAEAAAKAVS